MGARTYTVTERTDLHFDGSVYRPGDPVELPDAIAGPLLADGIVAERKAPKGAKRKAAILAAAKGLDPDNAELRTAAGAPTVKALEAALGFDITEAERDEAHAAAESERKGKA